MLEHVSAASLADEVTCVPAFRHRAGVLASDFVVISAAVFSAAPGDEQHTGTEFGRRIVAHVRHQSWRSYKAAADGMQ